MNIKQLKANKKSQLGTLSTKSGLKLPCWIHIFQGIKDGFAHGFQACPKAKSTEGRPVVL